MYGEKMASPILNYEPGIGATIIPPPPAPDLPLEHAAGESGVTFLIEGQSYVDVVFPVAQPRSDWQFIECTILNTADANPLNIWPGIVTDKSANGFRLQLNGMPDSANYYLDWEISGATLGILGLATSYLFSGPTSGPIGMPSTFAVALPAGKTLEDSITIIPDDGGAGGSFSPVVVELSAGLPSATFSYTPIVYGPITISVNDDAGMADPASLNFISTAATYTLTGPATGLPETPSTAFTVALPAGGVVTSVVTVVPTDGTGGGSFAPTFVTLTTAAPSATFIYTPTTGTKTIHVTNNRGLINPPDFVYLAIFDPLTIAGCKLWLKADALALANNAPVPTWFDSSGNGNHFPHSFSDMAVFKTLVVNGKPVLRFSGIENYVQTGTLVNSQYTFFAVISSVSTTAQATIFESGAVGLSSFGVRRSTNTWAHVHYDTGYVEAQEAAGVTAGAWNVITADWDGSNIHLWRNKILKGTTVSPSIGNLGTTNTVGYNTSFHVDPWIGDIAEILYYNVALSATNRGKVEDYLKEKYGIP